MTIQLNDEQRKIFMEAAGLDPNAEETRPKEQLSFMQERELLNAQNGVESDSTAVQLLAPFAWGRKAYGDLETQDLTKMAETGNESQNWWSKGVNALQSIWGGGDNLQGIENEMERWDAEEGAKYDLARGVREGTMSGLSQEEINSIAEYKMGKNGRYERTGNVNPKYLRDKEMARKEYLSQFAKGILTDKVRDKQNASTILNNADKDTFSHMMNVGLDQAGYMSRFATTAPISIGVGAAERWAENQTDGHAVDADGNLIRTSEADGTLWGLGKAIAGSAAEIGVEKGLGKLLGIPLKGVGMAAKAIVPSAGKWIASKTIGKLSLPTRALVRGVYEKSKAIGSIFGLNGLHTEYLEEYVQGYIDQVKGLGLRSDEENQSIEDFNKEFWSWDGSMRDITLGILTMQLATGAVGLAGYSAQQSRLNNYREGLAKKWGITTEELDNMSKVERDARLAMMEGNLTAGSSVVNAKEVLEANGAERELLDKLTDAQADELAFSLSRAFSQNGNNVQLMLDSLDESSRSIINSIMERNAINADGVNIKNFSGDVQFGQDSNGQPIWHTDENGRKTMTDYKYGIAIVENADGSYAVEAPNSPDYFARGSNKPISYSAKSPKAAFAEAQRMAQTIQAMHQVRQQKNATLQSMVRRLLGDTPYEVYANEARLEEARPDVVSEANNLRKSSGMNQKIYGFRHKDGTVVFLLDSIESPADILETILHENGVHQGLREVFSSKEAVQEFLLQSQKDVEGRFNKLFKHEGAKYAMQLADAQKRGDIKEINRIQASIVEEVLATTHQNRIYDPTTYQRAVHGLRNAIRKIAKLDMNESDIEVIMAKAQQSSLENNRRRVSKAKAQNIAGTYNPNSPITTEGYRQSDIRTRDNVQTPQWASTPQQAQQQQTTPQQTTNQQAPAGLAQVNTPKIKRPRKSNAERMQQNRQNADKGNLAPTPTPAPTKTPSQNTQQQTQAQSAAQQTHQKPPQGTGEAGDTTNRPDDPPDPPSAPSGVFGAPTTVPPTSSQQSIEDLFNEASEDGIDIDFNNATIDSIFDPKETERTLPGMRTAEPVATPVSSEGSPLKPREWAAEMISNNKSGSVEIEGYNYSVSRGRGKAKGSFFIRVSDPKTGKVDTYKFNDGQFVKYKTQQKEKENGIQTQGKTAPQSAVEAPQGSGASGGNQSTGRGQSNQESGGVPQGQNSNGVGNSTGVVGVQPEGTAGGHQSGNSVNDLSIFDAPQTAQDDSDTDVIPDDPVEITTDEARLFEFFAPRGIVQLPGTQATTTKSERKDPAREERTNRINANYYNAIHELIKVRQDQAVEAARKKNKNLTQEEEREIRQKERMAFYETYSKNADKIKNAYMKAAHAYATKVANAKNSELYAKKKPFTEFIKKLTQEWEDDVVTNDQYWELLDIAQKEKRATATSRERRKEKVKAGDHALNDYLNAAVYNHIRLRVLDQMTKEGLIYFSSLSKATQRQIETLREKGVVNFKYAEIVKAQTQEAEEKQKLEDAKKLKQKQLKAEGARQYTERKEALNKAEQDTVVTRRKMFEVLKKGTPICFINTIGEADDGYFAGFKDGEVFIKTESAKEAFACPMNAVYPKMSSAEENPKYGATKVMVRLNDGSVVTGEYVHEDSHGNITIRYKVNESTNEKKKSSNAIHREVTVSFTNVIPLYIKRRLAMNKAASIMQKKNGNKPIAVPFAGKPKEIKVEQSTNTPTPTQPAPTPVATPAATAKEDKLNPDDPFGFGNGAPVNSEPTNNAPATSAPSGTPKKRKTASAKKTKSAAKGTSTVKQGGGEGVLVDGKNGDENGGDSIPQYQRYGFKTEAQFKKAFSKLSEEERSKIADLLAEGNEDAVARILKKKKGNTPLLGTNVDGKELTAFRKQLYDKENARQRLIEMGNGTPVSCIIDGKQIVGTFEGLTRKAEKARVIDKATGEKIIVDPRKVSALPKVGDAVYALQRRGTVRGKILADDGHGNFTIKPDNSGDTNIENVIEVPYAHVVPESAIRDDNGVALMRMSESKEDKAALSDDDSTMHRIGSKMPNPKAEKKSSKTIVPFVGGYDTMRDAKGQTTNEAKEDDDRAADTTRIGATKHRRITGMGATPWGRAAGMGAAEQGNDTIRDEKTAKDEGETKALFRMAGIDAAARLDASDGGERCERYKEAVYLLNAGAGDEYVWAETGWAAAADGTLRFELDDPEIEFTEKGKRLLAAARIASRLNRNSDFNSPLGPVRLGDIVTPESFNETFTAFPGLDDTNVTIETKDTDGKAWTSVITGIHIPCVASGEPLPLNIIKEILIHEIQHAMQDAEGRYSGASPNTYKNFDKEITQIKNDAIKNAVALDKYRRTAGEVEARDSENRESLDADTKKYFSPNSGLFENIPLKNQLITKNAGKTSKKGRDILSEGVLLKLLRDAQKKVRKEDNEYAWLDEITNSESLFRLGSDPDTETMSEEEAAEFESGTRYNEPERGMPHSFTGNLKDIVNDKTKSINDKMNGIGTLIRRKLQDSMIDLKNFEKELGVDIEASAYNQLDANNGLNAYGEQQLKEQHFEPIFNALTENGIQENEFNEFLLAMAGPARNRMIYERTKGEDGNGVTNGSGRSTAYWQAVIQRFKDNGKYNTMYDIGEKVWLMNYEALDRLVDSGRMSEKQAEYWKDFSPFYVPERTDFGSEDEGNRMVGEGKKYSRDEFIKAGGRSTVADSPLQFSMLQAVSALRRANDNIARQKLAAIFRKNPEFGTIHTAENGVNPYEGVYVNDGKIVPFKEDGQLKWIQIRSDKDFRGDLIGNGVKKTTILNSPKVIGALTNAFAALRTSASPEFVISNFLADNGACLRNLTARFGVKAGARFEGVIGKSAKAAFKVFNNKELDEDNETDMYAREWAENGGMIGGYAMSTIRDVKDYIAKDIQLQAASLMGKRLPPRLWFRKFKQLAEKMNAPVEMGSRIAVYQVCREQGMSIKEAVSFARDVTVNFNRKGEWTPVLNSLYAFSNAAIQGIHRNAVMLGEKGGRGKAVFATMIAIGILSGLWNGSGDDEDDAAQGNGQWSDTNDYRKQNSINIRVGDGLITLPVRGLDRLPVFFGTTISNIMQGKDAGEEGKSFCKFMLNNIVDPIGSAPTFNQQVTPSIFRALVEGVENTSFTGAQLARESPDKYAVKSEMGRGDTARGWHYIARALNKMTGGSQSKRGWLDYQPEIYRHYANWLGGSLFSDIGRVVGLGIDIKDNSLDRKNVPFVRRVWNDLGDNSTKYYKLRDEFKSAQNNFKAGEQTGDRKVLLREIEDSPYLHPKNKRWNEILKETDNVISKLRKMENETRDVKGRKELKQLRMITQYNFIKMMKNNPFSSDFDGRNSVNEIRESNREVKRQIKRDNREAKKELRRNRSGLLSELD